MAATTNPAGAASRPGRPAQLNQLSVSAASVRKCTESFIDLRTLPRADALTLVGSTAGDSCVPS